MAPQEKNIKPSPASIYDGGQGEPTIPRTSYLSPSSHTSTFIPNSFVAMHFHPKIPECSLRFDPKFMVCSSELR